MNQSRTQTCLLAILFLSLAFIPDVKASTVEVIQIPSKAMNKKIPATLILPDAYENSQKRFPVTYLLHGAGNNYRHWNKLTSVAELSDKYGVIFVCPDGNGNSWYFDSPINPRIKVETFISKECVSFVDKNYRTKASRDFRAICGVSMGGHGALYLSSRNKGIFGTTVVISGGVDIRPFPEKWSIKNQLGDIATHSENWEKNTVINVVKELNDKDTALSIECGTRDIFIGVNRDLHKQLLKDGITHEYHELPGTHGWVFWVDSIKRQMKFIDAQFNKTSTEAFKKCFETRPVVKAPDKTRAKVLIIGDSISIGYTNRLRDLMGGKSVEIVHNRGNGGPTISGIKNIDNWLGDTQWDVIQFNWGLWDMYGWGYMKQDRSPAMYEKRLEELVSRLEKTDAKLIWATTTPICPELEVNYTRFGGKETDIISPATEREYLNAAARVMKKHNIEINDLHGLMLPLRDKYALAANNVHYTGQGYIVLARQTMEVIEKAINRKR